MLQQIIALIIILYFIIRLLLQKQKQQISKNEFIFWFIFWIFSAVAISSLKWIDKLAINFGFSSSGIDILLYIGIIILFYLIFKIRLKLENIEKNITKIVRKDALEKIKKYDK